MKDPTFTVDRVCVAPVIDCAGVGALVSSSNSNRVVHCLTGGTLSVVTV